MAKLLGENINLGFGIEVPASRGTVVAPQAWVPGKAPTGVNVEVKKIAIRETRGSGVSSTSSEVVQAMAGGDLEFYPRSETLGYLFKSLLGSLTTTTPSGSYKKHAFTLLVGNAQYPTLTLALSQAGSFQDYSYKNAVVSQLDFKAPAGDMVTCKAAFKSTKEDIQTAYTVSFASTDYPFRSSDVSVKIASNVAGLAGATAINVRDLSLTLGNNSKEQQFLGSTAPGDILATVFDIKGEMTVDYEDATYHAAFAAGTPYAMLIKMERADIDLGSGTTPKVEMTFNSVTYEKMTEERKLDDIVTIKLSFEGHYLIADTKAIEIDLYNTVTGYVNT